MSDSLTRALSQLNDALDRLEQTAKAQSRDPARRSVEIQRMAADRARLAKELDEAKARSSHLNDVNGQVSRRLVDAMEKVRSVMEKG